MMISYNIIDYNTTSDSPIVSRVQLTKMMKKKRTSELAGKVTIYKNWGRIRVENAKR